jgi:hypothetical protein
MTIPYNNLIHNAAFLQSEKFLRNEFNFEKKS